MWHRSINLHIQLISKRGNKPRKYRRRGKKKKKKEKTHISSFFMEITSLLCLVLLFISSISIIYSLKPPNNARRRLPPGPKPYPIIGNILEIGKDFHRSFDKLSEAYGPVISLYIGNKLVIVVSSPEIAKEILMNNHGRGYSNQSTPLASKVQDYDRYSLVFRTDNEWQRLRKICKEQLFSTRCLDASQHLRREMMRRMCDYVGSCSVEGRAMDMGEASFVTMLNLISASLFSTDAAVTDYESGDAHEFRESVEGVMRVLTAPNIADFFPILKPFDPQGIKKLAELHFGKLFSIYDGFINRRLEARRRGGDNFEEGAAKKKNSDMLETLIDIMETSDDGGFTCTDIKHLLTDLYAAATSTTSAAVEWIMTELLRNPNVMTKVQDEVRTVFGKNNDDQIPQESDIMSKLPYLRAVIKETLRHHPPASIFSRGLEQSLKVNGYVIPKGSQVFINVFTIGRDPIAWSDPDKFDPERFINIGSSEKNNNIDFKGQDLQFIPFGSGKRICPGLPLADRMMHNMIATLVHKFDWKLTMKAEDLDMEEKSRFALQKKVPLILIPVNYRP